MAEQYNMNNPSIKRIMKEIKEMERENNPDFTAHPLEDNIFEWHFTIRGPRDTDFEGGIYHGRISLPSEYPFKPPNIILLTPNGRFEVGKKICLSISAHHPEHWQPSWSIRTVLVALIGFMPTKGDGAIGALDYKPEERKTMAEKSKNWKCEVCGSDNATSLPPEGSIDRTENANKQEQKDEDIPKIIFAPEKPTTTTAPVSEPPSNVSTQQNAPQIIQNNPVPNRVPIVQNDRPQMQNVVQRNNVVPQPAPQNPLLVENQLNQIQNQPDVTRQALDYLIMAILVAIVGLIIKKMFYNV
eukprot:TRINITY_DN7722_c0_g1_i1.p1 TRINITY_DN7722_c0_g1~~TRINITY_DN7722_c0_g1_i1.p1  ORF type:complete len:299 (+),score=68.99 TRINITY_DN7722_c0_g1_i1:39-935(+)